MPKTNFNIKKIEKEERIELKKINDKIQFLIENIYDGVDDRGYISENDEDYINPLVRENEIFRSEEKAMSEALREKNFIKQKYKDLKIK